MDHTRSPALTAARWIAAVFVFTSGVVHFNLWWREYYRDITTVGPLFLAASISALVIALALVVLRSGWVDLAAAGFTASTLGAYVLTLELPKGLFHFTEPYVSYSGTISILVEAGTVVVLAGAWLMERRAPARSRSGAAVSTTA